MLESCASNSQAAETDFFVLLKVVKLFSSLTPSWSGDASEHLLRSVNQQTALIFCPNQADLIESAERRWVAQSLYDWVAEKLQGRFPEPHLPIEIQLRHPNGVLGLRLMRPQAISFKVREMFRKGFEWRRFQSSQWKIKTEVLRSKRF